MIRRSAVPIGNGALMTRPAGSGASMPFAELKPRELAAREQTCDPIEMPRWIFLCFRPSNRSLPASVFGKTHGVLLVQVKVSGKLPQVWFALGRLVDLKKQVDGVLPVSICGKETETLRTSLTDTEKAAFLHSSHQRR